MDAPERGALMLVRFIAASLMGMSIVELALYGLEYKFRQTPVNILLSTLWIVAFLVGATMLIKAKAIAEWISDRL
jgi:hypothetical protein